MSCPPFQHDLGFLTDREDYVECKKCFTQWKLFDGTRARPTRVMAQARKVLKEIKYRAKHPMAMNHSQFEEWVKGLLKL